MARTVAIGIQDFAQMREGNCFYVDKTSFIKEWWESKVIRIFEIAQSGGG